MLKTWAKLLIFDIQRNNISNCQIAKASSSLSQSIPRPPFHSNSISILGNKYETDDWTNIPSSVVRKSGAKLHLQLSHPLWLVKKRIASFFAQSSGNSPLFTTMDDFSPVVSTNQNFDDVLVPQNHIMRSKSSNYYINEDTLLRAHTSAHQVELLRSGLNAFLMFGDVYRRDTIDSTHFPVFHQCEGVRLFTKPELNSGKSETESVDDLEQNLKKTLEELMKKLFETTASTFELRWVPGLDTWITRPSWQLQIEQGPGNWVHLLTCRIMDDKILENAGHADKVGWSFGLGMERLAMSLYDIPDIRLFWCTDSRFLNQFRLTQEDFNNPVSFQPFTRFQPVDRHISFSCPAAISFEVNDLYDIIRDVAGDFVEKVQLVNRSINQENGHAFDYRITFRHFVNVLTEEKLASMIHRIEESVVKRMGAVLSTSNYLKSETETI